MTLDQCILALLALEESTEADLEGHADIAIDGYLAGHGTMTAQRRDELARQFRKMAKPSNRTDRIMSRILKEAAN